MVTSYLDMLLRHIYSTSNILPRSYLASFELIRLEQKMAAEGRENTVFDMRGVVSCG